MLGTDSGERHGFGELLWWFVMLAAVLFALLLSFRRGPSSALVIDRDDKRSEGACVFYWTGSQWRSEPGCPGPSVYSPIDIPRKIP